jgi:hypothetical protein
MSAKFYTYVYFDPRNMEPFYVGKGFGRRDRTHIKEAIKWDGATYSPSINSFKLKRIKDILSSGREPVIVHIIDGVSNDEAIAEEQRLIQLYGRADLGLGPLTNLTDGGEGRVNPSAEERQLKSKRMSGTNNVMYGKTHTEKVRLSLSEQAKARNWIGENNPMYGQKRQDLSQRNKKPKRWINDGTTDKQVLLEVVDSYIADGWVVGRLSARGERKSRGNCAGCNTTLTKSTGKYCSRVCANQHTHLTRRMERIEVPAELQSVRIAHCTVAWNPRTASSSGCR